MNNEDFRVRIDELAKRLHHLTQSKGAEYTHGKDNRFDNFERQAAALGLTREQVLFVFLTKHMDSITTYIADRARGNTRNYSESMTGRVDDAILYLLILRCMIEVNERMPIVELRPMGKSSCKGGNGEDTDYSYTLRYDPEIMRAHDFLDGAVSMTVGGVTTPLRDVELRPESENGHRKGRRVVISTFYPNAANKCREFGIPPSVAALTAPDQLFGLTVGDRVTFVHGKGTPDLDRVVLGEVRERSARQGFELDVVL